MAITHDEAQASAAALSAFSCESNEIIHAADGVRSCARVAPVKSKHYPHVDGLRAIAISLVMLEHFGGEVPKYFSAGYYGVDLFFVISGFLITAILLRTQGGFGNAFKTFMGRRLLRIFPVYYLTLLVLLAFNFENTRRDIFWLATYTWNYVVASRGGGKLAYLWSLSVEEQFYLFWPIVVLTLRRNNSVLMVLTMAIVSFSYCQLVFRVVPELSPYNYHGLVNRMGSLGLGAVGAIAILKGWIPKILLVSRVVELLTWGILVWALTAVTAYRLPVLGVCSTILMLKAVEGEFAFLPVRRILSNRVSTFIGKISYGIYMYHWPLGLALNHYVFDPIWLSIDFSALGPLEKLRWHSWIVKLPLVYCAVVAVAWVSYRCLELPLLKLKDRWFPNSVYRWTTES